MLSYDSFITSHFVTFLPVMLTFTLMSVKPLASSLFWCGWPYSGIAMGVSPFFSLPCLFCPEWSFHKIFLKLSNLFLASACYLCTTMWLCLEASVSVAVLQCSSVVKCVSSSMRSTLDSVPSTAENKHPQVPTLLGAFHWDIRSSWDLLFL